MHSWYSSRSQPFEYYNYTIFVAEVASTFNEQLLTEHLLRNAADDNERAYLINNELDSIRATVVRQTMFAEFEKRTHEMAEAGEPLTVESFRRVYRSLLEDYFGPEFVIDKSLELECFRIPHFYRAFYVYKYATGLQRRRRFVSPCLGRRTTGTARLPLVLVGRLQQGSARPASRRGGGHDKPRSDQNRTRTIPRSDEGIGLVTVNALQPRCRSVQHGHSNFSCCPDWQLDSSQLNRAAPVAGLPTTAADRYRQVGPCCSTPHST